MNKVKENIEKLLSKFAQIPISYPDQTVNSEYRRPSLVAKLEQFKDRCLGQNNKQIHHTTISKISNGYLLCENTEQNANIQHSQINDLNIMVTKTTSVDQPLVDLVISEKNTNHLNENETIPYTDFNFNVYLKMFIHELRTPISTISMGLSLLENDDNSNENKHIIKDMNESVVFIENIFSKFIVIQDGNIKLNSFDPFSLDDLLQNVISLLHFHIQTEDVWLEYKIHSDVADVNYGDKYNIKHCIINIVKNAIKYRMNSCKSFITIDVKYVNDPKLKLHVIMPTINVPPLNTGISNISSDSLASQNKTNNFCKSSISFENPGDTHDLHCMKSTKPTIPFPFSSCKKPTHSGRNIVSNVKHDTDRDWLPKYDTIPEDIKRKKQTIQIIICDNNEHILPHIKTHLFESFNSTSGSGLGLYICKNIIELHGGTIIHEFIVPIGNQFTITLPLTIYHDNL